MSVSLLGLILLETLSQYYYAQHHSTLMTAGTVNTSYLKICGKACTRADLILRRLISASKFDNCYDNEMSSPNHATLVRCSVNIWV